MLKCYIYTSRQLIFGCPPVIAFTAFPNPWDDPHYSNVQLHGSAVSHHPPVPTGQATDQHCH